LKDGTLTEINHPIQPLEAKDFFDEKTLQDITEEEWTDMEPFEDCENENFKYVLDYDKADLLVICNYIYMLEERSIRLAFDWNGHEFVRKPEADVCGSMATGYGFNGLEQWSEASEEMEDFGIE
jgi:hypothetical protein